MYDVIEGKFRGNVVIPNTDHCYQNGKKRRFAALADFQLMFEEKALTRCEVRGEFMLTIYNITPSHNARYPEIKIYLTNPKIMLPQSTSLTLGRDLYHFQTVAGSFYVVAYLESNRYKPIKTQIRTDVLGTELVFNSIDRFRCLFFCIAVPGPKSFGFRLVKGPATTGTSNTILEEIAIDIPPYRIPNAKLHVFYFLPDGAYLHFIPHPRRHDIHADWVAVDIYNEV
jgi:hypothetical protein